MKPQDIAFLIVLVALVVLRKPRILAAAGIVCFILAIPLFQAWVFFTAQRLVMYGAAFIFLSAILMLIKSDQKKK